MLSQTSFFQYFYAAIISKTGFSQYFYAAKMSKVAFLQYFYAATMSKTGFCQCFYAAIMSKAAFFQYFYAAIMLKTGLYQSNQVYWRKLIHCKSRPSRFHLKPTFYWLMKKVLFILRRENFEGILNATSLRKLFLPYSP